MLFETDKIYLRPLEPSDLPLLYTWENDAEVWKVSESITPYSKYILRKYIENSSQDIFQTKQLRLVIVEQEGDIPVGAIDLFDFDPHNGRAGIGILIYDREQRGKGCAGDALTLMTAYCFDVLRLHQLYCNVDDGNQASLNLFRGHGFQEVGLKKEWLYRGGAWRDEWLLQLIDPKETPREE